MAIHIRTTRNDRETVLKVDGQLKAEDITELLSACQLAHGTHVLDLSELQSADSAGITTLQELLSLGAEIRHPSPYIELLLKTKS